MANTKKLLKHVCTPKVIAGFATTAKPGRNKGSRGQKNETLMDIPNSSNLTDGEDFEYKTYTWGQSIKVTMLNHCLEDIIENSVEFGGSKVGIKLQQTWYTGYRKDGEMLGNVTVNPQTDPEHYQKLGEDFAFISSRIKASYRGGTTLGTITGPNKLLQIRTAASKRKSGGYKPLEYKGKELKDKGMAFFLCGKFGRELFS